VGGGRRLAAQARRRLSAPPLRDNGVVPRRVSPAHGLTLTEAAVLALLAIEGERTGYDLLQLAGRAIGHVWRPARSQLYTTLDRLARAGLASDRRVEQRSRPDKRLYRLTPAGREALDRWLTTVEVDAPDSFMLRVFVGGLIGPAALLPHLEQYLAEARERLARYEALAAHNSRRGHDYYHHLTLRLAIPRQQVAVAWAEEVLAELRTAAALEASASAEA
jgi:DNA-binding PadR family transcriptional regulator